MWEYWSLNHENLLVNCICVCLLVTYRVDKGQFFLQLCLPALAESPLRSETQEEMDREKCSKTYFFVCAGGFSRLPSLSHAKHTQAGGYRYQGVPRHQGEWCWSRSSRQRPRLLFQHVFKYQAYSSPGLSFNRFWFPCAPKTLRWKYHHPDRTPYFYLRTRALLA